MKMKLFLLSVMLVLSACGKQQDAVEQAPEEQKIIVYADPHLEGFARVSLERFLAENPGIKHEVKVIPTSEIIQHIRNGQPVDVALMFNSDARKQVEWHKAETLTQDRIVLVQCNQREKAAEMQGQDCYAQGSTGSVDRDLTDTWVEIIKKQKELPENPRTRQMGVLDSCLVVGNSYAQLRDYIFKGWVRGGFILESTFRQAPQGMLTVLAHGLMVKEAWSVRIPTSRPHPQLADRFLNFVMKKDIRVNLSAHGFVVHN